jgi:catechol 2,3-dioxygenase-like lactoylglutathione lyase family enzyme
MGIQRMEHVGVVVEDLPAAIAFFRALGLELEGEATVEGEVVDRIIGLEGARSDIAILVTPDGHGKLELTRFHAPPFTGTADPRAPSNAPGLRHVLFQVDDLHAAVAIAREHGGDLVGTVENYADRFLLAYLRGPEGLIVELAERIG